MAGAKARNIDFSQVKDGGNFNKARIPAGDYAAIIAKVEDAVAKDDVDQYLFTIKIKTRSQSQFPYYCKLQENQLWKLRNIFIAAGKTVPKKKMKVDPNTIVGKLIGVTIEDAEWDGKEQSEVVAVFPAAELDADSPGGSSRSSSSDDDDEPEDDEDEESGPRFVDTEDDEDEAEEADEESDEEEADEEEEADPFGGLEGLELRAALKNAIKAVQNDFVAKKSQTNEDLRAIYDSLADSDDEDEEPEPAPKPKAAAKKRAAKPKAEELSDEDIDELNIDDL